MTHKIPNEVYSVLEAFKPAVKSIDVRTVVVAPPSGEEWQNLVTSVFITENAVDVVKNQHSKIPRLRNNNFALLLDAYPFDYTFFGNILEGEVRFPLSFGIEKVRFRKFDPLKLKFCSKQARIKGSYKWILSATDDGLQGERMELWSVADANEIAVKREGFPDIGHFIQNRLQIEYHKGSQKDFELSVPPLASIEKACFVKSEFEVEVKKVPNLTNLQLNLTLKRDYDTVWMDTRKVGENKSESTDVFVLTKEVFQLDNLLPYDLMTVELIHNESALVMDATMKYAPLENVVEPFLKTLNAFCPSSEFSSMLLEPEEYGKEPQRVFENAVTWLLSLAGYNTIYLGFKIQRDNGEKRFDVLRAKSGYEIGSADIIGYEENSRLLLVDCDIGPIDERKIQRLKETGKYLSGSFKEYPQLKIIPVLATPKKYEGAPRQGVRIVDRNALEKIIKELAKGNRDVARNIFCDFGW